MEIKVNFHTSGENVVYSINGVLGSLDGSRKNSDLI